MVRDVMLLAESHGTGLDFAQVVTWQARPQVMFNLKLQSTVKPIHVGGTLDVESGQHLHMRPTLVHHGTTSVTASSWRFFLLTFLVRGNGHSSVHGHGKM